MSVNEDHTLDLIRRDLKLMKRVCENYEGRVLKSTGDGLLMHFISAVKAVECAIEIQREITQVATSLALEDTLKHRIGIHLADIFISETDVMGNGVNIAARLQAEADPGGICISQTVYDVVKAGLQLETQYLGPRELKNIREVVPAYKILLNPEAGFQSPFADVVRSLEQHHNLLRIKKLLFYVCKNTWESDADKLNATNLSELLQELLQVNPTLAQIERLLDTAVRSLSKPAEYSLVASAILNAVEPLYPASMPSRPLHRQAEDDRTEAITSPASQIISQPLYEPIAAGLQRSANAARIQKLIFYVCRNRWENDPIQLESLNLQDLIAELHQLAPTLAALRQLLNRFVETLSKRTEYTLIANTIIDQLQPLYPFQTTPLAPHSSSASVEAERTETINVPAQPVRPTTSYSQVIQALEQDPNAARIKKLMLYICRREWETDTGKLTHLDMGTLVQELHRLAPTIDQLESNLQAIVSSLNKPAEYGAIAQTLIRKFRPLYLDPPVSRPAASQVASPVVTLAELLPATSPDSSTPPFASEPQDPPNNQTFNLFDARLGIMKYANPLRAKIVIFSALHSDFDFSGQDWLSLRMYELDGLLRQLLDLCKSYTDLEALLYAAARRLPDAEENVEIASVIIKCLRPFYLYGGSVSTLAASTEVTQIDLDFDETRLELEAADEDDRTCELMLQEAELDESIPSPTENISPNQRLLNPEVSSANPTVLPPPINLGEVKHARE